MIGIVNIRGFIGEPDPFFNGFIDEHTTLLNVVKQVESNKDATEIHVFIDSQGGVVEDGYRIFNYLQSVGKPVTTFINGQCFSIATVIFLSGTRRIINTKSEFMIHAPWMETAGDAAQLEEDAEALRSLENELVNFYNKHTGISKAALKSLIESDTYLTPEEAVALGFATEIETTIKEIPLNTKRRAVAYSNKFKKMSTETVTKKEFTGFVDKIMAKLNDFIKSKAVAITLTDSNGVEIEFPEVEEGQSPAIGDTGLIDGAAVPDGSYVMPGINATVTFSGGVISEIMEGDTDEVTALKAEIERLKIEAEAKDTEIAALQDSEKEIKNDVLGFKQELDKLKVLAGKIEPDDKKDPPKKDEKNKKPALMKEGYVPPSQRKK